MSPERTSVIEPGFIHRRLKFPLLEREDRGDGELCERYADVAGRVVNGWYPTGFDRVGYGSASSRPGTLFLVHLSPMTDLHDEHDIGGLDAVDYAVVANTEAAGASEAVAEGLAELEGVGGELGFDGAADSALG